MSQEHKMQTECKLLHIITQMIATQRVPSINKSVGV